MRRDQGHHEFELRVELLPRESYGLALFERGLGGNGSAAKMAKPVVRIWGDPLRLTIDRVLAALRGAKYRPSDLRPTRTTPFCLREEDGVRLGLLFLAIKPLKKISRIEEVAGRVGAMEPEELWYWYSKGASPETGRRALRALRILTAEE